MRSLQTGRISLLAKLLDRQTATQLQKEAGLSVAEWRVLAQLNAKSPATVRMIADLHWVDRAEVSRPAASLVEKGLVQRRDNPDDKRSTLFSFTPDGLSLFGRMRP